MSAIFRAARAAIARSFSKSEPLMKRERSCPEYPQKKKAKKNDRSQMPYGGGGTPGSNLPFSLKRSAFVKTVYFTVFFGIPLGAPWILVRHQMLRGINSQ